MPDLQRREGHAGPHVGHHGGQDRALQGPPVPAAPGQPRRIPAGRRRLRPVLPVLHPKELCRIHPATVVGGDRRPADALLDARGRAEALARGHAGLVRVARHRRRLRGHDAVPGQHLLHRRHPQLLQRPQHPRRAGLHGLPAPRRGIHRILLQRRPRPGLQGRTRPRGRGLQLGPDAVSEGQDPGRSQAHANTRIAERTSCHARLQCRCHPNCSQRRCLPKLPVLLIAMYEFRLHFGLHDMDWC
mmetsp:Transcript_3871/g.10914  ORF Transcript_3871/g.10914 Transcript_3871/m.10914 type:complete len:244 (+) Transcript_3871:130-861(+)